MAYEVNLPDLHLGKLGWGEEVGENYDIAIAKSLFISSQIYRIIIPSQSYPRSIMLLVMLVCCLYSFSRTRALI